MNASSDRRTTRKNWNQPLCLGCWCAFSLGRRRVIAVPVVVPADLVEERRCCVCGSATVEGIFVRLDPDLVVFPAVHEDEPDGGATESECHGDRIGPGAVDEAGDA